MSHLLAEISVEASAEVTKAPTTTTVEPTTETKE